MRSYHGVLKLLGFNVFNGFFFLRLPCDFNGTRTRNPRKKIGWTIHANGRCFAVLRTDRERSRRRRQRQRRKSMISKDQKKAATTPKTIVRMRSRSIAHSFREAVKWLSSVIKHLLLLHLMIGLKISRQFFNKWEAKPKPIAPCARDFSRSLSKLQVIARNSVIFYRICSCCDLSG